MRGLVDVVRVGTLNEFQCLKLKKDSVVLVELDTLDRPSHSKEQKIYSRSYEIDLYNPREIYIGHFSRGAIWGPLEYRVYASLIEVKFSESKWSG